MRASFHRVLAVACLLIGSFAISSAWAGGYRIETRRPEVHLGEEDEIGLVDRQRDLVDLVEPTAGRQDHSARVTPQEDRGAAGRITVLLDEQVIQGGKGNTIEGVEEHRRHEA